MRLSIEELWLERWNSSDLGEKLQVRSIAQTNEFAAALMEPPGARQREPQPESLPTLEQDSPAIPTIYLASGFLPLDALRLWAVEQTQGSVTIRSRSGELVAYFRQSASGPESDSEGTGPENMGGASRELVLNDAEIHTLAPLGAPNTARDDEWSSPNLEDLKKAKLLDARAFTNRSTNQLPLEILLNEPGEIGAFARSTFNGLGETEPSDASQLYSQIDVIAVTTNRFRSVAELLRSIRLHLPQELNITVVVQSKDSARWRKLKKKYRANFIHVAEDLGLSECRNLAIKETSRGLIFLMDDDFQIDERCRLDAAIGIMIRHPEISVLGGNLLDVEHWDAPRDLEVSQGFAMHMLSDKDRLTWLRLEDAPRIRKFVNPVDYYELCDVVDNFALMRRMPVFDAGARWNPELKIGAEHQDFYVTLKRLGISGVARTNCLKVRNVRVQSRKFKKMRNRTDHYFNLFFRGLGLVSFTIIGERLRAFSTDGTSAYMEQPGMAPIFPPNQGAK